MFDNDPNNQGFNGGLMTGDDTGITPDWYGGQDNSTWAMPETPFDFNDWNTYTIPGTDGFNGNQYARQTTQEFQDYMGGLVPTADPYFFSRAYDPSSPFGGPIDDYPYDYTYTTDPVPGGGPTDQGWLGDMATYFPDFTQLQDYFNNLPGPIYDDTAPWTDIFNPGPAPMPPPTFPDPWIPAPVPAPSPFPPMPTPDRRSPFPTPDRGRNRNKRGPVDPTPPPIDLGDWLRDILGGVDGYVPLDPVTSPSPVINPDDYNRAIQQFHLSDMYNDWRNSGGSTTPLDSEGVPYYGFYSPEDHSYASQYGPSFANEGYRDAFNSWYEAGQYVPPTSPWNMYNPQPQQTPPVTNIFNKIRDRRKNRRGRR